MGHVVNLPRSTALGRPLLAALYARVSRDPKGRRTSTRDQFDVGEEVCEEFGWEVYDYYEDDDRSATRKARKARKDFERLKQDAEAGLIDVIVYAEKTRIARNLEVSIPLRSLCDRTGVLIYYDGRLYNMAVPGDRRDFTRDAVSAEESGEEIIGRASRTSRLNAKRGRPSGPVPFGYRRRYDPDDGTLIGQELHPEHGPALIHLFDMIDQGKSRRTVLAYARQFRPTMTLPGLKLILTNRSYLGIRKHNGSEFAAEWPRLVADDVFHRVQARIADVPPQQRREQTLLSGESWCASCRTADPAPELMKMRAVQAREYPERVDRKGKHWGPRVLPASYCCEGKQDVAIVQHRADAYVEEALLTWLSSPAAADAFHHDDRDADIAIARAQVDSLTRELEEAQALAKTIDPATGLMMLSVAGLVAVEQGTVPALQKAEQRLRKLLQSGDPLIDSLITAGDRIDHVWNYELDMDQRRSILRACVRIEVLKATQRGRVQPPIETRIRLLFFGEPGFDEWPAVVPQQRAEV